jgi:phosphatidylinositol-3-phosphatase
MARSIARTLCLLAALSLLGLHGAAVAQQSAGLPPIHHVFVLLLENQADDVTFAKNSPAPYLSRTLTARGARLTQYYAIGHASLDNYLALVSGQAPNHETQLDCGIFTDFTATQPMLDEHGQLPGAGCVYPPLVRTLPDQLEGAGLTWKAYMEDMGNNPAREAATCAHVAIGARETTDEAQIGDQYAARHNPFVYFHSIIDDRARCDTHVVNLEQLPLDLKSEAATANFIFITPNLCNDGHDAHCVDGRRGGLTTINVFLRKWVPLIEGSPAFRADGLLIITFDESDRAGAEGAAACCNEKPLPGARYKPGFSGPGGGRIGAVLLSPFVRAGASSAVPYNHYSMLRTVEQIFGLPGLGYAADPGLNVLGADVFSAPVPPIPAQ